MNPIAYTLVALVAIALTACDNKAKEQVDAKRKPASEAAAKGQPTPATIAYVEVDSIVTQYEYCKEYKKILEDKQKAIENEVNSKGKALENAMRAFQKDMQEGKITSEADYNKRQQALTQQQQAVGTLQEKRTQELLQLQDKYNGIMRDSLQSYLQTLNADKKYSLILSKQGDNILYADPTTDITAVVINGMNERYKKSKK